MIIGGLAHAAGDAIPHLTDLRFLSLEGHLVFLEEVLFVNSVINEIPRKLLLGLPGSVDEKIRVGLLKTYF
jgi:hypothetical protein